LIVLLVGVTALAAAANANSAEFPARPIRLVVPYAAGGPTDILGRLMADFLGRDLGQAAFVENKSGANGAIGAETVARAEADGYTLLVVAGSMIVLNPLLYKKLSYDPARDFRVLALITEVPVVMEVHPRCRPGRSRNLLRTPNKIPASSVSVQPGREAPFTSPARCSGKWPALR